MTDCRYLIKRVIKIIIAVLQLILLVMTPTY
ncbi:small toxic protein shoB [Escherichia coli]|nr:small toxic protein shoB [Escherichia coli]MWF36275.1 small toxic protein shoB [Escherichia coli]MWF82947.1 small toxic protein shoB [Escherichia coli]